MDFFANKSSESHDQNQSLATPLAELMRPRSLDDFIGQDDLVGPGTPLRKAIESDRVSSIIFWGPPGSGKTTLARLIAAQTKGQFIPFSAVSAGIKQVKAVLTKARDYFNLSGRRTYIFIDEIHRFNKAQQDAFLPYVESGDITLLGATTENPSFEVNSALLSRMRVYVLGRLAPAAIETIIERALADKTHGLGEDGIRIDADAIEVIAKAADGDARRALTLLEACIVYNEQNELITVEMVGQVHRKGTAVYDKSGEGHFNLISALHKTIRGGDPDASLYWLARMLDGGEDPMYILRRLVRFATEDIGLADPYALTLTLNARDTYHFLGPPEGHLAIAEAVIYMSCAPKSNSVYTAFTKAQEDAQTRGSLPVPLWLRNAPTDLMKTLGYGKGYQYAHDHEDAMTDQEHMPSELGDRRYYKPTDVGREQRLKEYLEKYHEYRRRLRSDSDSEE